MRHVRLPKHWLNLCKHCGYTWYPKGKAVSMQCPRCGNRDVTLAPLGCGSCLKGCGWLFILLFVLSALSRGCAPSAPTSPPTGRTTSFLTATPPLFSASPAGTPDVRSSAPLPEVRRALPAASAPSLALPANSDSPPPIAPPGGYVVTGIAFNDTLNVRSGPGSNYEIVARLPNGCGGIQMAGGPIMNGTTRWVRISFGKRQFGWVTANFLKPQ